MSLLVELKRRNVFRVVAAYVVLSWLMLQVGDIIFDAMNLPDWSVRLLIAMLVLGFVPAVVFSWVYELTPEGVKRESEIDRTSSETGATGKKLNYITIGMIALGIAVVVIDRYVLEPTTPDSPQQQATTAPANDEGVAPVNEPAVSVDDRSIAVLPFLNLSSDQEQEYFSDGLADTILHKLAQLPDLRVAARTSSFKFKGHNEDMRDIASQLGVATVLEGSVQRQGNRVRITVQLIKGIDGSHLWSQVFDDTLDDIFRVQDDIARGVADAMASTWQGADKEGVEMGGTERVTAYEAYLKGTAAANRGTPDGASEALAQLELAVELDPDYALAWAALSRAYLGPAEMGTATWESTYIPMTRAAERAIELAPDLASAHLALADSLQRQGVRSQRRRDAIERAVELAPNDAAALSALAGLRGRDGALREALKLREKAALLSPLDTDLQVGLAFQKVALGLVDPAIASFQRLIENDPTDLGLRLEFARLLELAGKQMEAASLYKLVLDENPDLLRPLFGSSFLRLDYGDPEGADKFLRRVEVLSPNRALDDRAEFCMMTGDRECADEYASRYLELVRAAGTNDRADLYEGALLIYRGEFDRAVELLEPRVEDAIADMAADLDGGMYLALAYDRIGDTAHRDQLLDKIENALHEALANGLWPRLAGTELVQLAAIRGDAKLAADRLAVAVDNGATPTWPELQYHEFYARVRSNAAFQEQMARVKEQADQLRENLIAEGIW
jgi:TolB-like protein/tetratricopeptide (TPR) repeat protein